MKTRLFEYFLEVLAIFLKRPFLRVLHKKIFQAKQQVYFMLMRALIGSSHEMTHETINHFT